MESVMKKRSVAILIALTLPVVATAQQAGLEQAAATITEAGYAQRINVIAHDSMGGRNTPSAGLEMTAVWIAKELEQLGLRGGARDGSFIQRYPLRSIVVDSEASGLNAPGTRLVFGRDLIPVSGATVTGNAQGGLVLISGSGTLETSEARPFAGNHVIVVAPADLDDVDRSMRQRLSALITAGALSVMVTNSSGDESWTASARRALRPTVRKAWGERRAEGSFAPILQLRMSALREILEPHGISASSLQERSDSDIEARLVEGLELTLNQVVQDEGILAPNVVGILNGSDPALAEEYVVFSAHMDHVGIGEPDANGDTIFNGADDDASGTIAIVSVAEAMAALPVAPKRSMVFLLVSGEEKGLWGSEWYAENPSAPIEQYVANFNADMVGRNWPDTIVAIGKEHSDLGETLRRVNSEHPEIGMTAIDDLWPDERFYFRSDHYNFARKGVPILFFFNGTHDDYHGRDDEPNRIDHDKAARIAKLMFYLGVDIGNALNPPEWNPESYRQIVLGR